MAASKLVLELDTPTPMWAAQQLRRLVDGLAKEYGYELTDSTVTVTLELDEASDAASLDHLRAALDAWGVLQHATLREDGE